MSENSTEKVIIGDLTGTLGSGTTESNLPPLRPPAILGVVGPPTDIEKAPVRVAILREAASLITGDRQKEYGSPEVNFQRIASIWNVLAPGHEFKPRDVALLMAGLKLARAAEGYKRDSAVDAAGYLGIYAELSELLEESRNND